MKVGDSSHGTKKAKNSLTTSEKHKKTAISQKYFQLRSNPAHFAHTFASEITNKGVSRPQVKSTRAADAWERYFVFFYCYGNRKAKPQRVEADRQTPKSGEAGQPPVQTRLSKRTGMARHAVRPLFKPLSSATRERNMGIPAGQPDAKEGDIIAALVFLQKRSLNN